MSNESLIIPRYGAAAYGVVLSRSLRDAEAQDYAYDSYSVLGKFQFADPDFREVAPTEEFFVVLPPDKSYEYEYSQPADISLTDPGDPKSRLRSGDYFLQIRIQTWGWDRAKAKDLQQRWAKHGYFWYYDVKSEPMLLRIEKPDSVTTRCQ